MLRMLARALNWKQLSYEKRWLRLKKEREREDDRRRDYLKPQDVLQCGGVAVRCYLVRSNYGSTTRYYEFGKPYASGPRAMSFSPTLSQHDLDDLAEVVRQAKQWRGQTRR